MTLKISHHFHMAVKRKFSAMAVRFWEKVERLARKRREQRLATFFETEYPDKILEDISFEEKALKTHQVNFKKNTCLVTIPAKTDKQLDYPNKSNNNNMIHISSNPKVLEQSHSWIHCHTLKQQNLCYKNSLELDYCIHPKRPIAQNKNNLNTMESSQKVRTGVHIHPQDITFIEGLDSSRKTHSCTRENENTLDLDLKDLTDPQISSYSKDHPLIDVETFPVMFTWNKGGREIYLMGDFTRWKPVRMTAVEGAFVLTFHLPAGSYVYNFIVDDVMTYDDRVRTVYLVNMKRNKVSVSRELNERTRSVTEEWLWRRTYMGEAT